jgi:hypothetical protein
MSTVDRCYIWTIRELYDCPFDISFTSILDSQLFVIATNLEEAKRKIRLGYKSCIWLNAHPSDLPIDKFEEKEIWSYIIKKYIKKNSPSIKNISKMIISVGNSGFLSSTKSICTSKKCFIWDIDFSKILYLNNLRSNNILVDFWSNSKEVKTLELDITKKLIIQQISEGLALKVETHETHETLDTEEPIGSALTETFERGPILFNIEVCIIAFNIESARNNLEEKIKNVIWLNNKSIILSKIEITCLLNYIRSFEPRRICGTQNISEVIIAFN